MRKLADLASESDAVKELREELSSFAKLGITSIQDMSNAIAPERCLALFDKVPSPIGFALSACRGRLQMDAIHAKA